HAGGNGPFDAHRSGRRTYGSTAGWTYGGRMSRRFTAGAEERSENDWAEGARTKSQDAGSVTLDESARRSRMTAPECSGRAAAVLPAPIPAAAEASSSIPRAGRHWASVAYGAGASSMRRLRAHAPARCGSPERYSATSLGLPL